MQGDPEQIRLGLDEAQALCEAAAMGAGASAETARAIATEIGLLDNYGRVLDTIFCQWHRSNTP